MTHNNTNKNCKYENLTDEEIVILCQSKDKNAINYLLDKYRKIVYATSKKFFIIGEENEDICQEGMIGLFKAIMDYDDSKQISFKNFANLCIERQILTAIKNNNRQKHIPLNSYVSLNQPNKKKKESDDEDNMTLMDIINTDIVEDPLETLANREYFNYVNETVKKSLSPYEKQVLDKYIEGNTYNEIAESLGTPMKSVDNAMQRIRKKTIKNIDKKEN